MKVSAAFLSLVFLLVYSFSAIANEAVIPNCLYSSDLKSDQILKARVEQPCVYNWAKHESEKTVHQLRSEPLYKKIESFLPTLAPSNSSVVYETRYGHLIFEKGSLVLYRRNQKQIVLNASRFPQNSAASEFKLSPDGKKLLIAVVQDGSDIAYWHFYDLENAKALADQPIRMRVFYISWSEDSKGVYYTRWPSKITEDKWAQQNALRRMPVAYHQLGTSADKDITVFETPEKIPSMLYTVQRSLDKSTFVSVRFFPTMQPMNIYRTVQIHRHLRWTQVLSAGDHSNIRSRYLGRAGDDLYFVSSLCGNEHCIAKFNIKVSSKLEVHIPKLPGRVITEAQLIGSYFYVQYLDRNFNNSLAIFNLKGQLVQHFDPRSIGLTSRGDFSTVEGTQDSRNLYVSYSAVNLYPVTLKIDLKNQSTQALKSSKPEPSIVRQIESELHYYPSLDGTMVPIQIFRKKGNLNPRFSLLYYYGAISLSTLSSYSPRFLTVLEMGGVVAIAAIRGGGELGDSWARIGALDKMKTAEDIAGASRWLKKYKLSGAKKVIAEGGSWGGQHTYMASSFFSEDFDAFVSLVPSANSVLSFQGVFGWLLPDDVLFERDHRGDFLNYDRSLQSMKRWSAFHNFHKTKVAKPMLTIGSFNDERTGPSQSFLIPLLARQKFGANVPNRLIMTSGGGHGARSLAEELTFIGLQGMN